MLRDPQDSSRITSGEPPEAADRRKNAGSVSELPDETDVPFVGDDRDESADFTERRDGRAGESSDEPGESR